MIHAQTLQFQNAYVPVSTTGDVLSAAIDTAGCAYVTIIVAFGVIHASGPMTALSLTEATTSGGTYSAVANSDITDAVVGTAALPAADDDDKLFVFEIEVAKLTKRFVKVNLSAHASNASLVQMTAIKSRLAEVADTAAGRGAEAIVRI